MLIDYDLLLRMVIDYGPSVTTVADYYWWIQCSSNVYIAMVSWSFEWYYAI